MRPIIALAALSLLAACSSGGEDGPTQRQQIGQVWKYEGGAAGQAKVAYIGSANSVQTPTAPDTFAVLLVQPMSNGEKTVTVKLVGAPFQCDLSACAGRLTDAKDGVELPPSQKAYETIAASDQIKVDLIVGPKDETAAFTFNVAGLDLPA